MPRTPYWAIEGKQSQCHHAQSPQPHIIIGASCISSTDCTVFNLLQSHLKGSSGLKVTVSINYLLLVRLTAVGFQHNIIVSAYFSSKHILPIDFAEQNVRGFNIAPA